MIEASTIKKNATTTQETLNSLSEKRFEIENSLPARIQETKERRRSEVMKESSAHLESELSEYESELSTLAIERKTQLDHFSFENIKLNFFKGSILSEDTMSEIEEVKREASSVISERFMDAYFDILGRCRVPEEEFLHALENLSSSKESFLLERSNFVSKTVSSISNKVKDLDVGVDEGEDDRVSTPLLVGFGVISLILSFVIFPIYSIILMVVIIFNFRESKAMKYCLDFLKIVEDNYKFMENVLSQRAVKEYEKQRDIINKNFDEASNLVRADIAEVNSEISTVRQAASASFVFDSSEVEMAVKVEVEAINHSINEHMGILHDLKNRAAKADQEVSDLQAQYKEAIKNLEKQYIDFERVGDSKFYIRDILLEANDPPMIFRNPGSSWLYLYQDKDHIINYIKLFCMQLRCNVHPSSSLIEIWDTDESGVVFSPFRSQDSRVGSGGFNVLNTTEHLKDSIATLDFIFQKRLRTIRIDYDNITQYNTDMIKLNSVTENYYTILVLSSNKIIGDERFQRLIVSGPDVGIYIHIFVDAYDINDSYFPIIEKIKYRAIAKEGQFGYITAENLIASIVAEKSRK